jgi:metal-responsive CopG/Arc/MetJ family transcriptional regulator
MSAESLIAGFLRNEETESSNARITITLPGDLISRIDTVVSLTDETRSYVIQYLLEYAFNGFTAQEMYLNLENEQTSAVGDSNV